MSLVPRERVIRFVEKGVGCVVWCNVHVPWLQRKWWSGLFSMTKMRLKAPRDRLFVFAGRIKIDA